MKKTAIVLTMLFAGLALFSCKKEKGVCYCKYYSGDKKEFDLRHLPRAQQEDTCALYNQNAAYFVGDCKLK